MAKPETRAPRAALELEVDIMKHIVFVPQGPFGVPWWKTERNTREIPKTPAVKMFWEGEAGAFADDLGVIVFGLMRGETLTPWYVTKARKSFFAEALSSHRRRIYSQVLTQHRGDPMLTFLVAPRTRSWAALDCAIRDLETEMIQYARFRNPRLANAIGGLDAPPFAVQGVLRSKEGRRRAAVSLFRKEMGM